MRHSKLSIILILGTIVSNIYHKRDQIYLYLLPTPTLKGNRIFPMQTANSYKQHVTHTIKVCVWSS